MRDILEELPKTIDVDPNFVKLFTHDNFMRGMPTPLIKAMGNPHQIIKPLRQAIYSRLGVKRPINEKYPTWNKEKQDVEWIDEKVLPDDSLISLLDDP